MMTPNMPHPIINHKVDIFDHFFIVIATGAEITETGTTGGTWVGGTGADTIGTP